MIAGLDWLFYTSEGVEAWENTPRLRLLLFWLFQKKMASVCKVMVMGVVSQSSIWTNHSILIYLKSNASYFPSPGAPVCSLFCYWTWNIESKPSNRNIWNRQNKYLMDWIIARDRNVEPKYRNIQYRIEKANWLSLTFENRTTEIALRLDIIHHQTWIMHGDKTGLYFSFTG